MQKTAEGVDKKSFHDAFCITNPSRQRPAMERQSSHHERSSLGNAFLHVSRTGRRLQQGSSTNSKTRTHDSSHAAREFCRAGAHCVRGTFRCAHHHSKRGRVGIQCRSFGKTNPCRMVQSPVFRYHAVDV